MGDQRNPSANPLGGMAGPLGSAAFQNQLGNLKGGGGMLAGGSMGSAPTAGSSMPTALPYGPPSVPGAPGPIWGPGATFIQPGATQGGQQFPEIIGATGQASIFGPQGWTPAGQNATVPTGGPLPTLPGPGTPMNSIPGQPLRPYLGLPAQDQIRQQLYAGLQGGGQPLANDYIQNTLLSALSNPAGDIRPGIGQVPGYAMPQDPIQFLPAPTALGLEKALQTDQLTSRPQIDTALSGFYNSLGRAGPTGLSVPTIGAGGMPKK